jgi:hypothetical protein
VRETKQRCRLARAYDGVAHVMEVPYGKKGHVFWFGAAEVSCAVPEAVALVESASVLVALEDGRSGRAVATRMSYRDVSDAGGGDPGEAPGETLTVYFVGRTALEGPAAGG